MLFRYGSSDHVVGSLLSLLAVGDVMVRLAIASGSTSSSIGVASSSSTSIGVATAAVFRAGRAQLYRKREVWRNFLHGVSQHGASQPCLLRLVEVKPRFLLRHIKYSRTSSVAHIDVSEDHEGPYLA